MIRQPPAEQLGLNRLAVGLISVQLLALASTTLEFRRADLHIVWSSVIPEAAFVIVVALGWLMLFRAPGRHPREWVIVESFMALLLFGTFAFIALPAQYGGVALRRPFIDRQLAIADAWIGVSVPALAAWWNAHPVAAQILGLCYSSFLVQVFVPIAISGFVYRERTALWEYLFHFHFCSIVAIAVLTFWPAACAPVYYGFRPGLDNTLIQQHLQGLHAGTLHVLRLTELKGVITLPSLHTSVALAVIWACRKRGWLFWPLVAINLGLITATFVSGIHYFVDAPAGVLVFAVSVAAYRWLDLEKGIG